MPRFGPGVRLHNDRARDGWMLLAPERLFELDEISLEILERVNGAASIGAIVDDLSKKFSANRADIQGDVIEFFSGFVDKRIILL